MTVFRFILSPLLFFLFSCSSHPRPCAPVEPEGYDTDRQPEPEPEHEVVVIWIEDVQGAEETETETLRRLKP